MGELFYVFYLLLFYFFFFFFQAEDGIRDTSVTGVQTCALPIWLRGRDVPVLCWSPVPPRRHAIDWCRYSANVGEECWARERQRKGEANPWRSEERRVGKECRAGWATEDWKR